MKQALILAGGKGTRLTTLNETIPKAMVQISGKPLIQHQIELCKRFGFEDLGILIHHKGGVIREFLGDGSNFGVDITYYEEKIPRGTAGAVLDILEKLADDFLIIYGDTYLNVDLDKFYQLHKEKRNDATLFIHPNNHPYDSDLVELNKDNYIEYIHRYPHQPNIWLQNLVNAALYVLNKKTLIGNYSSTKINDFAKNLFPKLLQERKKLFGYISSEYIKDIGTPDRLNDVILDIKNKKTEKLSYFSKKRAVFLDRDGVINEENGYIKKPSELKILNGVSEGIKKINDFGSLAIVITNQPVIARGDCTQEELKSIHNKLETLLGRNSAYVDAIYYCPHHPESGHKGEIKELKLECSCRKPKPGLLKKAAEDMNISLKDSWLIGDTTRDILAAEKMGVKNILLRTGHAGEDYKYNVNPDYVFVNFGKAVDWILKEHEITKGHAKKYLDKVIGKKLIFIGGLSKTGKSTWGQIIKELLLENNISADLISLDSWLLEKNKRKASGNVLQRFNMDAIKNLIKKIDNQQKKFSLDIPICSRDNHKKMEKKIRHSIEPNTTVILEGVPALCHENEKIENYFNFYMECEEKMRKERMRQDCSWKNIVGREFESLYESRELDERPIIEASRKNSGAIIKMN